MTSGRLRLFKKNVTAARSHSGAKKRATQAQVALVFLNSRPPFVRLFELGYLYHSGFGWVWGIHPRNAAFLTMFRSFAASARHFKNHRPLALRALPKYIKPGCDPDPACLGI